MRARLGLVNIAVSVMVLGIGCNGQVPPAMDGSGPEAAVGDAAPDAGPTGVVLALGALHTEVADASGLVRATLATPSGDEAFLLMLHARAAGVATIRPFQAVRIPSAQLFTLPAPPPPIARLPAAWRCGFDHQALTEVATRVAGQPAPRGQLPPVLYAPPPNPGELVELQVDTPQGVVTIQAEVQLVSAELVVLLDVTTDPSLTLDASWLTEIADGFERVALPRARIFFGPESDVNEDDHLSVLFSPLTAESGTAFVNPWDLVTDPTLRPAGVAANDQELLYVTPPALLEPHQATPRALIEILAHELAHAIYFYRKYLLNAQLGGVESVYLTEGLSELAQDLTGYQGDLFFDSKSALDQVDTLSANDLVLSEGGYFMDRPQLYGGAYLLLRYLYDQAGGDALLSAGTVDLGNSPGVAWLRALVDSPLLGRANLETAAGRGLTETVTDWFTALMVDDRLDDQLHPLNTDPRFNFLPPALDPLTGQSRGTTMFETYLGPVQKTGPRIRDFADADGVIRPGGVEYLRLEAASSPTVTFEIAADPTDVDLLVRIFRVR